MTFRGSMVALVTPFRNGRVDEAALKVLIERQIAGGTSALVPCGTTGESATLSVEEHERVIALTIQAARGRVPVIAGTGSNNTAEAIALTRHAQDAGADAALLIAPYYNRPTQQGLYLHFKAIADAVKIPLMVYNIPSANVNPISPDLASRLADIDTVVAIKESSFDLNVYYRTVVLAGDRIRVFGMGLPGLIVGGDGTFGVNANYWDEQSCEFYFAFRKGDREGARRIHDKAQKLRDAIDAPGRNTYVAIKAAMNLFGRPGGHPRLPLRPLAEPHLSAMRQGMERLGVKPPAALAQVAE